MIYILKIKGTDKIPDFVQIRDQDMTLRAYFRMDQQESGIRKNNLGRNESFCPILYYLVFCFLD